MNEPIYFDNAATTKICDEALDRLTLYSKHHFYNPSALYTPAIKIEKKLNDAQKDMKSMLNAQDGKLIFTSGGTESNNLAILGAAKKSIKKQIITSATEHPAVLNACKYLKESEGYDLIILPVDNQGFVNENDLYKAVSEHTFLVTIMHVNNETGTIQDIKKLCKIAKDKNSQVLFHSDGVQAYGKIDVDIQDLNVDMYTLSAHKLHGPKGVGVLYVKNPNKIGPIMYGGNQQSNYRSGTINHPSIIAFHEAMKIMKYNVLRDKKIGEIRNYIVENLKKNINDILFVSKENERFTNYILNIAFKGVNAETLVHSAQYEGLIISTGSACSSRRNVVSSTLKAMNVDSEYIGGAIRISLSRYNTLEEAKIAVDILIKSVDSLRKYTRN